MSRWLGMGKIPVAHFSKLPMFYSGTHVRYIRVFGVVIAW